MRQLLLLPDPCPLVESLGAEFFRSSPESPGVYLMRDEVRTVLYVGKAKNLRKRLGSYRVANPDRMSRRHLRLLRKVRHIDTEPCGDEAAALARESELLLELRPRFNRAGTWRPPQKFLLSKIDVEALHVRVADEVESGWRAHGPMGPITARMLQAALHRVLWLCFNPDRTIAEAPAGILKFPAREVSMAIPAQHFDCVELFRRFDLLLSGKTESFCNWVRDRAAARQLFEQRLLEADLDWLSAYALRGGDGLVPEHF